MAPMVRQDQQNGATIAADMSDFPERSRKEYQVLMDTRHWSSDWAKCVDALIELQRSAGHPVCNEVCLLMLDLIYVAGQYIGSMPHTGASTYTVYTTIRVQAG